MKFADIRLFFHTFAYINDNEHIHNKPYYAF